MDTTYKDDRPSMTVESGWGFTKALHPEDRNRYTTQQSLAIAKGQPYEIKYRLLAADGHYHWYSEQGTPVIAAGQIQDWIVSCTPYHEELASSARQPRDEPLKALQESEQRYRSLVIATSQIVWTTDAEGRVDDMPAWRAYTGQTVAEVKGWSWLNAVHPEDRHRTAVTWNRAVQEKTLYDTEYRIRGADGNYRYFWVRGVPVIAEDGSIREWVGVCADIHDRKRAEEELKISEKRYRDLANAMPLIVWTAQPNGTMDYYNQWWFDYTGLTIEQSTGYGWQAIIHPDDLSECLKRWNHAVSTGTFYEIEYRFRRKDGVYRWHIGRAVPVRDNDGQILSWVGTATDIDDRKRFEEALKESEARFRSMADNAPVMIWMSGTDTQCNWFNQPWLEFTGRSMEEEVGDGWAQRVHPDDKEPCWQTYLKAFAARQRFEMEYRFQRADGEYRWLVDTGVPRFTPSGDFAGYIGSCVDITERKATEAALKHRAEELTYLTNVLATTNAALEKRNQELDQFAYVASHDLKAPLRAIANLSQWIEEDIADQLNAENRRQMDLLRGRVHRLEALIDGLLQYSRVGRTATATELVNVQALLNEVLTMLAPPPEFTIAIATPMPTLHAQKLPLFQVFSNLISNAIKHHNRPNGNVAIAATDKGDYYEFTVSDDGPGIAPEYHEKVFGIFQTLEARDKVENTGVGLAIVKKIIESQGGRIYITSQEGQGATFHFTWLK
ncbi:PAS domain-containing protein [Chroococcidiopsis sp. TS-821]|uniref:PAS domain-containing sensor histidine kinase n=1 Tax=Chroococcidiopsis sp. TS-821 TaxID=1378066 RepID=UPI000CEED6C7|nr:PAS domain-containing protein [Chroococcidiopsis sp. TS-821]